MKGMFISKAATPGQPTVCEYRRAVRGLSRPPRFGGCGGGGAPLPVEGCAAGDALLALALAVKRRLIDRQQSVGRNAAPMSSLAKNSPPLRQAIEGPAPVTDLL